MVGLDREKFKELVDKAFENLPDKFKEKIQNVAITVEDFPSRYDLDGLKINDGRFLLGLYRGTPLPQRSVWQGIQFPDKIILFKRNIERMCRNEKEVEEKVNEVLLHEIAHYFGLSDKEIYELMGSD